MVVMVLEKVPRGLRGELSRWMVEVQTGVFVGKVSALVRDLLWEKCTKKRAAGQCCQVYRTNTEQGFSIRIEGDTTRNVVDLDGLSLIGVKNARWKEMLSEGWAEGSLTTED